MNKTSKADDVMVIDTICAPLSPEMIPGAIAGDPAWEGHPLNAKVIGFAAARMAVDRQTVSVTWYGLETGEEASVLDYARDVLGRDARAVVCYGGAHRPLRMLEHRLIEHGIVAAEKWRRLRRVSIDLCDEVAMHGHHPRASLDQAYDMYQLLVHPPACAHVSSMDDKDALSPESLATRLRTRVDAIVALYAHLRVGPLAGISGSLVLQHTARPSDLMAVAS